MIHIALGSKKLFHFVFLFELNEECVVGDCIRHRFTNAIQRGLVERETLFFMINQLQVTHGDLCFYGVPRKPVDIPTKAFSVFVTNLVTIINQRRIWWRFFSFGQKTHLTFATRIILYKIILAFTDISAFFFFLLLGI